jgi:putative ABC transport system permease protein
MGILRLIFESFRFAWQALKANLLRTMLSLLGVTVGIFSIIGVLTMVDSLEANIRNSLSSIGENTVYVDKFPWVFGADGNDYPWWKYFTRPRPKYSEFLYLKDRVKSTDAVTIMDWSIANAKYQSNSYNALVQGVTYDFNLITDVPITEGRYFVEQETNSGKNVAILGAEIYETLFPKGDGIGKNIKIKGQKFMVIGTQEKKGKQLVDVGGNPDAKIYIPFLKHKRMFSSGNLYGMIQLHALKKED